MYYMRYGKRTDCTVDEFIGTVRELYGYDVPTFRQALRALWESLTRTRRINRAISNLPEAIQYAERMEWCHVPTDRYPDEYWFRKWQETGYILPIERDEE